MLLHGTPHAVQMWTSTMIRVVLLYTAIDLRHQNCFALISLMAWLGDVACGGSPSMPVTPCFGCLRGPYPDYSHEG